MVQRRSTGPSNCDSRPGDDPHLPGRAQSAPEMTLTATSSPIQVEPLVQLPARLCDSPTNESELEEVQRLSTSIPALSDNIELRPSLSTESSQADLATPPESLQRGIMTEEAILESENNDANERNFASPVVNSECEAIQPPTTTPEGPSRIDSAVVVPAGNPQREEIEAPDENNDDRTVAVPEARSSEVSALGAPERLAENNDQPKVKELVINPKFPAKREYKFAITLAFVTLGILVFTDLYAYNASISLNPFMNLIPKSSDNTTFIILFLVQASILCLTELVNVTLQHLRWSWVSDKDGINILSFLTLSPMTSPITILFLLFARIQKCWAKKAPDDTPTPIYRRTVDRSVAALALQRY